MKASKFTDAQKALIITSQPQIARQRVPFVPAIREIATHNLLHCNWIDTILKTRHDRGLQGSSTITALIDLRANSSEPKRPLCSDCGVQDVA